jgi:hypothetical protein
LVGVGHVSPAFPPDVARLRGAERGSLWCPHITIHGEHGDVEIVMGDAEAEALVPSADTVAVLHPGTPLPDWSR